MCMWAICNTSTKWSPYNPSDGFHPIFHFILGISHEQESLMIDRHLFPVPCTTWKTEYKSLLVSSSEESNQSLTPPKISVKIIRLLFQLSSFTDNSCWCAAAPTEHRLIEDQSRSAKHAFPVWETWRWCICCLSNKKSESIGCKTL